MLLPRFRARQFLLSLAIIACSAAQVSKDYIRVNGRVIAVESMATQSSYTLTLQIVGSGALSGSYSCGSPSCTFSNLTAGSMLTFSASAGSGMTFQGWTTSASSCPGSGSCSVTLNSNVVITARFAPGLYYRPITQCRVVDTYFSTNLSAGETRSFPLQSGSCIIPPTAKAYVLNVQARPVSSGLGYVTIWPSGQPQPVTSIFNLLADGRPRTSAAVVPVGSGGGVNVFTTHATRLIIEISGVFEESSAFLEFHPITPCRIADTRNSSGPDAAAPKLAAGSTRNFNMKGKCGIPLNASAYSLNLSVKPTATLGFMTAWGAGVSQPVTAVLESSTTTWVANAAVIEAGTDSLGSISFFPSNETDLIVDVNGYFAPVGSPGGQKFYSWNPCRVVDTRTPPNALVPLQAKVFPLSYTPSCTAGIPGFATGYVLNATVIPPGSLVSPPTGIGSPVGYLTLWGGGSTPVVSTLNAIEANGTTGTLTSNLAIVPADASSASFRALANANTDVIFDINGYFAP